MWIILVNLKENIVFFHTPSEINLKIQTLSELRIGGMVKHNSVSKLSNDSFLFIITDYKKEITVIYNGILPILFRDGQGVVAKGHFEDGKFIANELLAKHDENYRPPAIP